MSKTTERTPSDYFAVPSEKHEERIKCPECNHVQTAIVESVPGFPFAAYIHNCEKCEFIIMESDWMSADE